MHLGSWLAIAEKVPQGGRDVWRAVAGAPVTHTEASDWGLSTAQRRSSSTGRMELVLWWSPKIAARVAAERGEAPISEPGSPIIAGHPWSRRETLALIDAVKAGGYDAAHAVLPGRSRSAIKAKAAALGLASPFPGGPRRQVRA